MPIRRRTFTHACAAAFGASAGHVIGRTATDLWPANLGALIRTLGVRNP